MQSANAELAKRGHRKEHGAPASTLSSHGWALRLATCLFVASSISAGAQEEEAWMLTTPEALPEPINLPGSQTATPWLSADGLRLYFASDRPGGYGSLDLWTADRASVRENWRAPVNLGPAINTPGPELQPCLSADELTLYFGDGNPYGQRPRQGGPGNYQIWTATRATKESPWGPPSDLQEPVGSPAVDSYPHVSADGLTLYFTSNRSAPVGLVVSTRTAVTEPWPAPINLGPTINQGSWSGFPYLSSSELHLLFYSDRAGGRGGFDLWLSTRATTTDAWRTPFNLGSPVNGPTYDISPCVSSDFPGPGSCLLFARNDVARWSRSFRIYRAEVIPRMSVQWASSLSGPWTPVDATFSKMSAENYQAETAAGQATASFYRLKQAGLGAAPRIHSAARTGNKFRIDFSLTE